jgi:CubicO group peptidase (beta-lactamase class C family)
MYKPLVLAVASVAFFHTARAQPVAQQIDAAIAPYFKPDAPGAAVIVVQDGKVLFRKGYGMADLAKGRRMDSTEQQRIGSITKQFTATAILILADEGKLSTADEVSTYLPEFTTGGRKITIEQLLTHTAGVSNYTSKAAFKTDMEQPMSVDAVIALFKDDPLAFEPGSAYAYSNSGYILLGAIIEKISGISYAEFIQQRIFAPLGMRDTAHDGFAKGQAVRAAGHTTTANGYGPCRVASMTRAYAAGAVVSTLDDLVKWNDAIVAGKLLKAETWRKALTSHTLPNGESIGYGYGWRINQLHGSERMAHGGGIPGHSAYVMRMPKEKLFIAVLANNDKHAFSTETIASRAATVVLGKPLPERTP